jgi:hypothetical protein
MLLTKQLISTQAHSLPFKLLLVISDLIKMCSKVNAKILNLVSGSVWTSELLLPTDEVIQLYDVISKFLNSRVIYGFE